MEPIFISSEHGDGLTDLYAAIQEHIPVENYETFRVRKEKRVDRFIELKEELIDEIIDMKIK